MPWPLATHILDPAAPSLEPRATSSAFPATVTAKFEFSRQTLHLVWIRNCVYLGLISSTMSNPNPASALRLGSVKIRLAFPFCQLNIY